MQTSKLSLIAFAALLAFSSQTAHAQARASLYANPQAQSVPLIGFTIKYKSALAASNALAAANAGSTPKASDISQTPMALIPHANPLMATALLKHNPSSTASPAQPILVSHSTLQAIINNLKTDANISEVSPNIVMKPLALSNTTPAASSQWHFIPSHQGNIDISSTWASAPASQASTYQPLVAIIDTGYTDHPDIAGKIVGQWDFVDNNADAHDTGDSSTPVTPSTWHGTKVSGTITTNNISTSGVNPHTRLLHARTLGPGGGTSENVANAIRWAAGIPVPGTTPHGQGPAEIINLSLGADSTADIPCSDDFKNAIAAAKAAGSVIVVATGNSGYSHIGTPANCPGVIAVGAATSVGDAAFYSNLGTNTTLLAPGGDYANPFITTGITSASDEHTPSFTPSSSTMGTSFATPVVSGSLSLLKSIFPSLSTQAIADTLVSSTKKFPAGTFCTLLNNQYSCGAGLLSVDTTFSKLLASSGAALSLSTSSQSYYPGSSITVVANSSPSSAALSLSSSDSNAPTPVQSGSSFSIPFPSNLPQGTTQSFTYTLRALSPSSDLSKSFTITAIAASAPLLETPTNPIVLATAPNTPVSVNLASLISDADNDFDSLSIQTSDNNPPYFHGISVSGSTITWSNPSSTALTLTIRAKDKTNLLSENAITITLKPTTIPQETTTPTPSSSGGGGGGSASLLLALLALTPLRRVLPRRTAR